MEKVAKPDLQTLLQPQTIWEYANDMERTRILNECAFKGYRRERTDVPESQLNAVLVVNEDAILEIHLGETMAEDLATLPRYTVSDFM